MLRDAACSLGIRGGLANRSTGILKFLDEGGVILDRFTVKTEPARPAPLSLHKGDRLSEVFSRWGSANGWDVAWQAPALISDIDITFTDGFESAVTQTIESLVKQGLPLRVVFYEGNKVVLIMGAN